MVSLTGPYMGSSITIERTSKLTKTMGKSSDLVVWWQLIATVIAIERAEDIYSLLTAEEKYLPRS
jgi:K+/H+ antiporter YhaU regulatory subunit KhtT